MYVKIKTKNLKNNVLVTKCVCYCVKEDLFGGKGKQHGFCIFNQFTELK